MIYNADLILSNTPFNTFLVMKLVHELYIFLWANHPLYGIDWSLFKDNDNYEIPVHILLINQEYLLFLGDENDLPPHEKKITRIAVKKLNFEECGSLVFDMLLEFLQP